MTSLYDLVTGSVDPDSPFLEVAGGPTWSYGEVLDLGARMATVIRANGVERGARLMVQVDKSAEAVALYLAALQVGAIYVPLNPAYTPSEIAVLVDDAEPSLIITKAAGGRLQLGAGIPTLSLTEDGRGSLIEAAAEAAPDPRPTPSEGGDPAAMLYTSGTTGPPKGALLSSDNLTANAEVLFRTWGWQPSDVLLHLLPLFHTHGLFVALNLAMIGGSRVLFHRRFDTEATLDALPDATVMMAVPTMYHRLLESDRLDQTNLAAIRLFTSGSAPLSAHVHNEFGHRTGHRILERYGMTETGMLTSNPLDGDRIAGTVGFALAGVELRIVGHDGELCPPDVPGSVEVRGPNVFSGYWRRSDADAELLRGDGYFTTGDVGAIDQHGRLRLSGRSTDLIITGGFNVHPAEVESHLDELAGVIESAVVGISHPDLGEAVVAVVVTNATFDEQRIRRTLGGVLASFKQPKRYVVVEELPRTAMGKVQKASLRAQLATLFERTRP